MTRALTVIAAVLTNTLVCGVAMPQDLAQLFSSASQHVVVINTINSKGEPLSLGSGFFIRGGSVVTNFHVIDSGTSATCKLKDGRVFEVQGVVAENESQDIALLSLIGSGTTEGLDLATSTQSPGTKIAVIGSPQGMEMTLSDGIISANRNEGAAGPTIQITAPISPGSSGGPVLLMSGEVVGVVQSTDIQQHSQQLNFAISALSVSRLQRHPVIPLSVFNKDRNANPQSRISSNGSRTDIAMPDYEIPSGAIDLLHGQQKRDLASLAKYSMILPNGDIVGLYRFYRTVELNNVRRPLQSITRHLEAMGNGGKARFARTDDSRLPITIEGMPPGIEYPSDAHISTETVLLDLPSIGLDLDIIRGRTIEGYIFCSVGRDIFVVRNTAEANSPKDGLFGERIYFPVSMYDTGVDRYVIFDSYDPLEHRPTLDEMAFHAQRGGAALAVYDYKRTSERETSTRRGGRGLSRYAISTPSVKSLSYTWNRRELKLTYSSPASAELLEPADQSAKEIELANTTHTIEMKDGRRLEGRVVSESRSAIKFILVIGTIEHEMDIRRSKIESISER